MCLPLRRASPQCACPARTRAATAPMHCLCACRTRCCSTRLDRRRRRRERLWLRCDHPSPRDRAQCSCRDAWRLRWRSRYVVAVSKCAVPSAALDIEFRAGCNELLGLACVALKRSHDERSDPAEKSVAGFSSVRPMQWAHDPYPLLLWASSLAPAAMSCSTTNVWPLNAAMMSAVTLPRSQLPG